jgi:hypothetical protein
VSVRPHVPPTFGSGWDPRNLAHVEGRPPIAPDLGGLGLIYPGKRHVFSGPPESAKTIAAYICALAVVRDGGSVLLVDFEMGQWDARDRLRELGADDGDLERILYVEPEAPATVEIVSGLIDEYGPTLVIIDAAAGAFDLQGLDDNKRADVERFAGIYVRTFFLRGVATIVLDHVVKDSRSRGGFVIGSERKVGGADVHLGFEADQALRRGGHGYYRILTRKDRLGHLLRPTAAKLELVSDPETHAITWKLTEPTGVDAASAWRPTFLMERVSQYLELNPDGVARNFLVIDGYANEESGPRGARLFTSIRPFRERDLVGTSSDDLVSDLVGRTPHDDRDSDLVGTSSAPRRTPSGDLVALPLGETRSADEVEDDDLTIQREDDLAL